MLGQNIFLIPNEFPLSSQLHRHRRVAEQETFVETLRSSGWMWSTRDLRLMTHSNTFCARENKFNFHFTKIFNSTDVLRTKEKISEMFGSDWRETILTKHYTARVSIIEWNFDGSAHAKSRRLSLREKNVCCRRRSTIKQTSRHAKKISNCS